MMLVGCVSHRKVFALNMFRKPQAFSKALKATNCSGNETHMQNFFREMRVTK